MQVKQKKKAPAKGGKGGSGGKKKKKMAVKFEEEGGEEEDGEEGSQGDAATTARGGASSTTQGGSSSTLAAAVAATQASAAAVATQGLRHLSAQRWKLRSLLLPALSALPLTESVKCYSMLAPAAYLLADLHGKLRAVLLASKGRTPFLTKASKSTLPAGKA